MGRLQITAGTTRWEPVNADAYYDQRLSVSWRYEF
jgi:hypothetical protein